jgi:hypothetical protein
MATLNEVMKDTADAIREKTGKSELIAPVDFAEEIKGITAGGGSGGGNDGWEYYKVDSSFNDLSSEEIRNINTALQDAYMISLLYYIGTITSSSLVPRLTISDGAETMGIKCKGDGMYYDMYSKEVGGFSFTDLAKEPFVSALGLTAALPFFNALTPCTKEEFEALE